MTNIKYTTLETSDLIVDAIYEGGQGNSFRDEPLHRLLGVDNQGGFRVLGNKKKGNLKLLVLSTTMSDLDWPDNLDPETGIFTYYGDNKKPGRELHDTGRLGNLILRDIFLSTFDISNPRSIVPPVLIFSSTGERRNQRFLGLAVPGAIGVDPHEALIAIWKMANGVRFQNYKAIFTVLDASPLKRDWIKDIKAGNPLTSNAPKSWIDWKKGGKLTPLTALRNIEYRTKAEQLPTTELDKKILSTVYEYFKDDQIRFEHCAAEIARMFLPRISSYDLTRPSRDGGRDATGIYSIGTGASAVYAEFAMEAKCWNQNSGVGVKATSRLISRLKHRQFGVFITTSYIDLQAYKEIKDDGHPVAIISGIDIVNILKSKQKTTPSDVIKWLRDNF